MLLIDGIKYELWIPPNEDELEQIVIEHAQDIFGDNSIYFDKKQKLRSLGGVGSIPDALVIMFANTHQWHIVEVELSSHDPYQHVVPQVDKFINAIDNPRTRNKIIDALYDAVNNDELLKMKTRQAIGQGKDIHKVFSDLIATPPTITIIIEKDTDQLEEALKKYNQKKLIEFQTFTRERVGLAVHAHLFEPLYKPIISTKPELPLPPLPEHSFEVALAPSCMKYHYIHIPKPRKDLFPNSKTMLELITDIGTLSVGFNIDPEWGSYLQKDFAKWFKAHPELKQGDRVRFTVLEPMKKYRLEIIK